MIDENRAPQRVNHNRPIVTSAELIAMARAMFEHPEWVGGGFSVTWHELRPADAEGWIAMACAAARGDLGCCSLSSAWWATLFGAAWAAVVDHRKNLDLFEDTSTRANEGAKA